MENQMTALSSVSIEEETLSKLLVGALKDLSSTQYKAAADLAAEAVKSAFAKLRGQNEVGQMTVSLGVKVDDQVIKTLAAVNKKTNILADSVSKVDLRVTELVTILSTNGYPSLMGR